MTVEVLYPASREEWLELRKPTIGASEVAAVLGVHPHTTPYELWARKSGIVEGGADNKAMRRGRLLEPIAVECIREERSGWIVTANPIPGGTFYFFRDLDTGLSCTPDAFVFDPMKGGLPASDTQGICQIKTVNSHTFQNEWMIDGEVQLPPYVAIQAMQEAHLTGASWCCVAALVGFDLDLYIIDVKIHAGVVERIKREVPEFLRRVRENDPPDPDYARDGATIAALYNKDDGGAIDLSGNERVEKLVARREAMKLIEASAGEAEKERKTIDAELIHALGNATRATLADGRMIEARAVHRNGFTVDATTYRSVKIRTRKAA
jgi:putative phage-type endonuclease